MASLPWSPFPLPNVTAIICDIFPLAESPRAAFLVFFGRITLNKLDKRVKKVYIKNWNTATAFRINKPGGIMKKVYVNEEVCIGCGLCEVYCRLEHSRFEDLIKSFKRESQRPTPLLKVERREPISFAVTCRHCDEPHCVYACITGALQRDQESGIVTVDGEKCIGC